MEPNRIIVKVNENKINGQKTLTVPKSAEHIKKGDYVEIRKLKVLSSEGDDE